MRNGRKPRMTLQTLATIAMDLFTICCACYIMTIIWSRIDRGPRSSAGIQESYAASWR